jgi:hypothetical protein
LQRGAGACCRCSNHFNNFILQFPEGSTAEDRALLVTAVLQMDYQLFEKKGGDNK